MIFFLVGSLAILTLSCHKKATPSPTYTHANVILIVIDTLRSDHLGCYGYSRRTSPNIDKLADTGIIFENMLANTSWTRPGVASILTGLYPKNHEAITTEDNLADEINLMSEILGQHGYTSYGIVTNHQSGERVGFNQGYKHFFSFSERRDEHHLKLNVLSDKVNEKVFQILGQLGRRSKNFIFIHYIDPHSPYTPKEKHFSKSNTMDFSQKTIQSLMYQAPRDKKYRQQVLDQMIRAYDDEILYNDKMIGQLISTLKRRKMFGNSIIIITSDHGEEFWEHQKLSHGMTLYQEQLRVPLIIHLPDNVHKKVRSIANQVDVLPTTLSLLGIAVPRNIDGMNLLASGTPGRAFSYAELCRHKYVYTSIQTRGEKLIRGILRNKEGFDNMWFNQTAAIDTEEQRLQLTIKSIEGKRKIQVLCDENPVTELTITPQRKTYSIHLPPSKSRQRVLIRSLDPCQYPKKSSNIDDPRCLSFGIFKSVSIDGKNLLGEPSTEFFSLTEDRREQRNLFRNPDLAMKLKELKSRLLRYTYQKRNFKLTKKKIRFDKKGKRALKALGYI
jgi:arylsulfatase A-like enzyme